MFKRNQLVIAGIRAISLCAHDAFQLRHPEHTARTVGQQGIDASTVEEGL